MKFVTKPLPAITSAPSEPQYIENPIVNKSFLISDQDCVLGRTGNLIEGRARSASGQSRPVKRCLRLLGTVCFLELSIGCVPLMITAFRGQSGGVNFRQCANNRNISVRMS